MLFDRGDDNDDDDGGPSFRMIVVGGLFFYQLGRFSLFPALHGVFSPRQWRSDEGFAGYAWAIREIPQILCWAFLLLLFG